MNNINQSIECVEHISMNLTLTLHFSLLLLLFYPQQGALLPGVAFLKIKLKTFE